MIEMKNNCTKSHFQKSVRGNFIIANVKMIKITFFNKTEKNESTQVVFSKNSI